MTVAMLIVGTFVGFLVGVLAMSLLRVAAYEQPALEAASDDDAGCRDWNSWKRCSEYDRQPFSEECLACTEESCRRHNSRNSAQHRPHLNPCIDAVLDRRGNTATELGHAAKRRRLD